MWPNSYISSKYILHIFRQILMRQQRRKYIFLAFLINAAYVVDINRIELVDDTYVRT